MTPLYKVEMTPPSALGGPVPPLGMTDFRHVTKCRGGSGPGFLGSFDATGSMGVPGKDGSPGRDGGSENSGDTGEKGRMVKIRFVPAATLAPFILNLISQSGSMPKH